MAVAIRLFGARPIPYLAIGCVVAGTFLLLDVLSYLAFIAVISPVFVVTFAVIVGLVEGDSLTRAISRCAALVPDLLLLALVVAAPFYLSSLGFVLLIAGAAWLALTAFAIPEAVLVKPAEEGVFGRAVSGLQESVRLARAAFIHAFGTVAALVVVQIVFSIVLGLLLSGYADNSRFGAQALAQIVLAPFFFLGLTVLYFDQRARAGEHRPERS